MSAEPPLSVVVLPVLGGPVLGSLAALLGGEAALPPGSEVLVVGSGQPGVTPTGRSVPGPLSAAVREARAPIIAVLEDTVRPIAGWGAAVLSLHRHFLEAAAIGGTLAPAPVLAPLEAALLALDYGPFLRAGTVSEPADRLPRNDVSFKRQALGDVHSVDEVVAALARRVGAVRCESAMAAVCVGVDPGRRTWRGRLEEGRLRANGVAGTRTAQRVVRAAAAPFFAAAQAGRGARVLTRLGLGTATRRSALPHLAWMSELASLGESLGYLGWGAARKGERPSP
jgi:hypothetical protein